MSVLSIPYRRDIDGLRAIAVLSVLLFHIHYRLVPAGYIGVDIFFVISGFLITRIIAREMAAGEFSFARFYVRRIMRILPVFFVVVAATLAVGMVLLLPGDLANLAGSVRYAIFFAANIFFSRERGYFDAASDELPLLHVWSLSVEEQYYFIWPLLLAALFAVLRLFSLREGTHRRCLVIICCCLAAACFVWTQYALVQGGSAHRLYFLLQARFGELMVGSIAAFPVAPRKTRFTGALGLAGLALVLAPMFILDKDSLFPGLNALAPCLGTGLLLYIGQSDGYRDTLISRLLSLKGMVLVGLLSYSLYLWHWPVLAYMRYVYGRYELPVSWLLTAVVAAFGLAWLTYALVEQTTRRRRPTFPRAFAAAYLLPMLVVLAILYSPMARTPVAAPADPLLTTYGTDVCHGNMDKRCVRGDPARAPTVLVTGDSHAAALNAFVDVVGRAEGWSARVLTASSCSPVFGFDEKVLPRFAWKPCESLKDYVAAHYRDYDAVVFTSFWAFQLGWTEDRADPGYLARLELTLADIARTTPVYVLADVPRVPVSPFRLAHFQRIGLNVHREPSQEAARANAVVRAAVSGIAGVTWVDLSPALSGFTQQSLYKGVPTYFDDQHLNVYGSTQLGHLFAARQRLLTGN